MTSETRPITYAVERCLGRGYHSTFWIRIGRHEDPLAAARSLEHPPGTCISGITDVSDRTRQGRSVPLALDRFPGRPHE